MNKSFIKKIVSESKSKSQVLVKLGYNVNGSGFKKFNKLIKTYNLDISHFDIHWYKRKNANPIIIKVCPICGCEFKTKQIPNKKEKITCSRGCANSYFRSGENHGNWNEESYRNICFKYHKKQCVVCDEYRIVEVHHYDGDHENNKKENLVPICSTHHKYWHSKYRYLIKDKVDNYVKNFIKYGGFGVIG